MTKRKLMFSLGLVIMALFFTTIISNQFSPGSFNVSQEDSQKFPKKSALSERRAYAIIVGIEDYPDPYSDLYYCVDDANALYSLLVNNYGIYSPIGPPTLPYMQVLLDSEATKYDIENAFSNVATWITSKDVFLFYFSGHGHSTTIPSLSYLVTGDVDHIYSSDLDALLNSVNCSEQYIIVDSCGSGGMFDDAQAPNRYFMTASERDEDSWETSALGHGVFTYFFLQSFISAPDSNGDGVISMEEQFSYIYPLTVSYSTGLGEAHHPQEYDGISGETVIDTTIGSLLFNPNGTQLDYSFFLYGHGSITAIQLTVCCVAENITIETFDLIPEAPSNTGFGFYSGMVEVSCGDNITGYQITAVVEWQNDPPGSPKTIQRTFGDADEDGLTDFLEIAQGLNPGLNDTDNDGLGDYDEFYGITDPLNNDTDRDGLLDGEEVFDYFTDPTLNDTDTDGLLDGEEVNVYYTNPLLEDTDDDELTDFEEVNQYFTEPDDPDTDDDGMHDGFEVHNGLDPFNNDTQDDLDGDDMVNIDEYNAGSKPDDPDTDDDGMDDGYEYYNDLDLFDDDTGLDYDNDNLTNIEEYLYGSFANNPDSDGDTMPDGWEYEHNLDLLLNDSTLDPDEDYLINLLEFQHHTDPNLNDTDGDGWLDGEEVLTYNTDPLDPDDYPTFPEEGIPGYNPILILFVILLFIPMLSRKVRSLYEK